ncbi:hypothetical protein KGM_211040 [Danaus plexippus plexippus]|uniref:Uncharacterized protein n=1 Tax=Danaus plexippus plexippus TaxID=278856 RepID=A0A212EX71_DANPL|nr:hypothetical protein KGM_211040 [Danaus plexippus plexippus]
MEKIIKGQQELLDQLRKANHNFKKANQEVRGKSSYLVARMEAAEKLEEAHVLKSLTSLLPSTEICIPHWLELRELPLADPKFATPSRVDMLLRANVFGDILLTRLKKSPFSNLIAQNTVFGWILSRKVSQELNSEKITTLHVQVKEDELLIRFWDIENEPNSIEKFLTEEEKLYMRKLL